MNTPSSFDARARQLHAAASAQLSPQTLTRLRAARHAAAQGQPASGPARPAPRWLAASAFSLALLAVVGVGLLRQTTPAPSGPSQVAAQTADDDGLPSDLDAVAEDPYAELDTNPDLFVWLGSDSQPLAME